MLVPTEVSSEIYAQIFDMVHIFELVVMYIVRMESWVLLPCYRNNLLILDIFTLNSMTHAVKAEVSISVSRWRNDS